MARRSSALPVPKAKGLDRVRARVAAEQKGRWVSIRTKSGKYVRVWIGPNGHERARPEYGLGKGAARLRPEVEARLDRREKVLQREPAGGFDVTVNRNPYHGAIAGERPFTVQATRDGRLEDMDAADSIERARAIAASVARRLNREFGR